MEHKGKHMIIVYVMLVHSKKLLKNILSLEASKDFKNCLESNHAKK